LDAAPQQGDRDAAFLNDLDALVTDKRSENAVRYGRSASPAMQAVIT
jgi:hypothetical protein